MAKFNYILNGLALIDLVTRNLYSKNVCREDKEELENQIKLIMQENQQLKERINKLQEELNEENLQCSKYAIEFNDLKEKNKELKDNWNYIKKMLKEVRQEKFNVNGYCGTCTDVDIDFLLNKMQELEQGSDNK